MDPISAVGLASSILTFVEFAVNFVTGSVQIYRSVDGALDENKQLDKAMDELDTLSGLLDKRPICKTEAERKITRIAGDCRVDSKKLADILIHIASPRNNRDVWRSLKGSWMSMRSRKDVTELKSRLQGYRSEALLQLSLLLREEQSSLSLGIAKIRDDCSQLKIGFRTDIIRTQDKILESINALQNPAQRQKTSETPLADISKMLLAMQTEVDETQIHHRILRQLVFKDMNSRANQVHKAAQDTYTWMLEDGPVKERDQRSHAWHRFLKWLRTGDNIFFVSGNPGSGKSTLMKFLTQHERTKEELAVWAGKNSLIFSVFYFWNSGFPAQRTLPGLYRSLLFQSLSQQPHLIERVFPLQFRRMRASTGPTTVEEIQGFDENDIEEAFNLLLDQASRGEYRLCFFIDGLDECEGNRLKHEELALKLQSWTVSGKVKLCVSSRPYSEFLEPLSIPKSRRIQLHDLNESDIRAYCLERFMKDIHARKRGVLCRHLAEIVVKQAQGVFLWVYLVIDILLIGLRQADPDSVLRAQLDAFPTDLDLLYTKLREPIEANSVQRNRSNRMLLLAAHNPSRSNLSAIAFSWLEEEGCDQGGLMNPDFPPPSETKPYSKEEISKRVDRVTKQINGLARGFLEVDTRSYMTDFFASTVGFCHRTARDYILHNQDRHYGLLKSFSNFEQSGVYTRIRLAEIIHGFDSKAKPGSNFFYPFTRSFCNSIDAALAGKFELPVQGILDPLYTFIPSKARSPIRTWKHRPGDVSFNQYAAFCGLRRFVLYKVTKDPTELGETSSCGNILLAALKNEQWELASDLSSLSRAKAQLCEVWDEHGKTHSLVPACVLAIARLFEGIAEKSAIRMQTYQQWPRSDDMIRIGKELLKFSISMKMSLRLIIGGVQRSHTSDDSERMQVQIDAAEAVKLLDSFELPESREVKGFRDRSILGKMSQLRLGRIIHKGTSDTTDRSEEWPDKPLAFSDHSLHKVEWALENQDLAEVKGWVRLF